MTGGEFAPPPNSFREVVEPVGGSGARGSRPEARFEPGTFLSNGDFSGFTFTKKLTGSATNHYNLVSRRSEMVVNIGIPEAIVLALSVLSLGITFKRYNGEKKDGGVYCVYVLAWVSNLGLLYWGGFFS